MQLIETNVRSAEGTTTVEFVGEGREKVSVCMVAHDVSEDAAVTRAKEIMVQLTAFDSNPQQQGDIEDETISVEAVETTGFTSEVRS
ncbi:MULTISPECIES: hypothetical protein [unclassified Shinella]|uniref:hypothetical protein n=1 Tax=unclassified Shinella TaxID=2643062 RepID=UPI00234EBEE0|nr:MULTISPECIES: hypothetical protein [unclassified Shinella]MCO5148480.1 hypothetical protein [Shinella sp.]MDC7264553.1 hypothetical protein [Shinella sp. HY16]MDC7271450.1 hypothetical protein [Shinella sp. YZ44]